MGGPNGSTDDAASSTDEASSTRDVTPSTLLQHHNKLNVAELGKELSHYEVTSVVASDTVLRQQRSKLKILVSLKNDPNLESDQREQQ